MTTPDTGLGPVDLLNGWTPGVHTMPQKYAGGASFVGVATKPWPEESGRLGKRLHRCEHRHRSREAALRCAERLAATCAGEPTPAGGVS